MQMDATEHTHSAPTAELAILEELVSAPLAPAELKQRVRKKVRGLTEQQYKLLLVALVARQQVHGRPKLGKNGRPTKTIEAYAFGAPPPPPPAPPPPRELAPSEMLDILRTGPLSAAELKARVKARVTGLSEKDYKAVLAELVEGRQVYGRRNLGRNGKPTKTVGSYTLGGPPAEDFIAPVLAKWNEARGEANAAGVKDDVLLAALLEALARAGVQVPQPGPAQPASDDRGEVLRVVRGLIAREGHGALIPIRKLRGSIPLAKDRFDAAVLQLYADDAIILHHHDYVGSLTDTERNELVLDRHGNYYVGVALRGES